MSDNARYERLVKQFDTNLSRDTAIINRVDFDFLLNSHNKHLKLQMEYEALTREFKKMKRLNGIESHLKTMGERKVIEASRRIGWQHNGN